MADVTLDARSLSVAYQAGGSMTQVLLDVDLVLHPQTVLGLAGESGCGKSTLALTLAGYRSPGAVLIGGGVDFEGVDLTGADSRTRRRLWGKRIAYLAQDSTNSLNPAMRVGHHFTEALARHLELSKDAALDLASSWLARVEIPQPSRALHRYPHQFSGGQQQRIALAIALACQPDVLLLDEPTTGLDVITQAQVNRLLLALVRELGTATLYVSHNLALLANVCDELAIMYAGQIVERGSAEEVCTRPRHPYTRALLAAVPDVDGVNVPRGLPGLPPAAVETARCSFSERCELVVDVCAQPVPLRTLADGRDVRCVRADEEIPVRFTPRPQAAPGERGSVVGEPILRAERVRCEFDQGHHRIVALDDVSVEVAPGRVLGVAGESGSGKSTLLKTIAGLIPSASGSVSFRGEALHPLAPKRPPERRRAIQLVFQNPDATLNPRHSIRQSLERPLKLFRPEVSRGDRGDVVADMLGRVGLGTAVLSRRPANLSGGQRQRVAIARALLAGPEVVLCDEVTSALDVSVQATILELLDELRRADRLSIVFVTHDLGVLRAIADDAVVMQAGVVRERASAAALFEAPQHDYTRQLLAAVPSRRRAASSLAVASQQRGA